MNKTLSVSLIALAAVAVGVALFLNGTMKKTRPTSGRVVSVQRGEIVGKIIETGSIEPAGVVQIKSEQSGEIKRLFTKPGDRVEIGQKLAVIQQESSLARQAAQFRAGLEEERLNMEEARRELERQRSLLSKGFVPRKDVETAEKNFEKTKVKFQLARKQLLLVLGGSQEALDQNLAHDLSSDQLDQFTITAPIAGTIISMDVEEGEIITSGTATVGGGTTLLRIADLNRMLVKTRINEVNIVEVHIGQPVEMWLDAVPGRKYEAVVSEISPEGERVDNIVTYMVTMEIKDPDEQLKPTMTANVDILTGVSKDVLHLPVEAVERKDGEEFVRIEEEGRIVRKKVSTGQRTESVIQITSGLREGDRVLIGPNGKAGD